MVAPLDRYADVGKVFGFVLVKIHSLRLGCPSTLGGGIQGVAQVDPNPHALLHLSRVDRCGEDEGGEQASDEAEVEVEHGCRGAVVCRTVRTGVRAGGTSNLTRYLFMFLIFSDFSDYKIMYIMLSPLGPLKKWIFSNI